MVLFCGKRVVFPLYKALFQLCSPTILSCAAVAIHYAMARNYDGYRVTRNGAGYGTYGSRLPYGMGYITITNGFTERNLSQSFPNLLLKSRTTQVKANVIWPFFKHALHYVTGHFVVFYYASIMPPAQIQFIKSRLWGGGNKL